MRRDELQRWRSRSGWAIVVGLFGGLALAVYALFWGGINGLAGIGCGGSSGCEERIKANDAHYDMLFYVALIGGGGLIAAGIWGRRSLGKRLRELDPESLPTATVVQRPESRRDLP